MRNRAYEFNFKCFNFVSILIDGQRDIRSRVGDLFFRYLDEVNRFAHRLRRNHYGLAINFAKFGPLRGTLLRLSATDLFGFFRIGSLDSLLDI